MSESTVRNWEAGRQPITAAADRFTRLLYQELLNISVSDDESLQILYESVKGQDGNGLAVRRAGDADWLWINRDCQHKYYFVGNIGSSLLFMSNENAPRWQLLAVDVGNTRRDAWATLIPEQNVVMESVSLVGDKLLVAYLRDAHSLVSVYTHKGQFLHDMSLPGVGSCYISKIYYWLGMDCRVRQQ